MLSVDDLNEENDDVIRAVREYSPLSREAQDAFIMCYKAMVVSSMKEKAEKAETLREMRKRRRATKDAR